MTKETKSKKSSKSRKLSISPEKELAMLRSIVEITNSSLELEVILKDVVKVMTDTTKADSV
ncbi:MAG: hypothetical protein ACI9E5_001150, partial [Candidatus Omnitrophota bacterium]